MTDATATANATTVGVDAAAGSDQIHNEGQILSAAIAESDATSVSVALAIGPTAAIADVESISNASATGIYGGAEDEPGLATIPENIKILITTR